MEKIVIPQFVEQNYQLRLRQHQKMCKLKRKNQKDSKIEDAFLLIMSIIFWIVLFFIVWRLLY